MNYLKDFMLDPPVLLQKMVSERRQDVILVVQFEPTGIPLQKVVRHLLACM
jgi:hypothetical protein